MYSEGFNPHLKLAFASALSVGTASLAEYMDIELANMLPVESIKSRLQANLPQGIRIMKAEYLPEKSAALMAIVNLAEYSILFAAEQSVGDVRAHLDKFNSAAEVWFTRKTPKGVKEVNIKDYLLSELECSGVDAKLSLTMSIRITPGGSIKPAEIMRTLVERFGLKTNWQAALISRTGLFITEGTKQLSPFEV
jgi:radical SAM-linked protein